MIKKTAGKKKNHRKALRKAKMIKIKQGKK